MIERLSLLIFHTAFMVLTLLHNAPKHTPQVLRNKNLVNDKAWQFELVCAPRAEPVPRTDETSDDKDGRDYYIPHTGMKGCGQAPETSAAVLLLEEHRKTSAVVVFHEI